MRRKGGKERERSEGVGGGAGGGGGRRGTEEEKEKMVKDEGPERSQRVETFSPDVINCFQKSLSM